MKAIAFIDKEGKKAWLSDDGKIHSCAISAEESSTDLETGFVNDEKFVYWVKARTIESATKARDLMIAQINQGLTTLARTFSLAPRYDNDTMDINPETNVSLQRYSRVIACSPTKRAELHRQFIEPKVAEVAPPVVTAPKEKVTTTT